MIIFHVIILHLISISIVGLKYIARVKRGNLAVYVFVLRMYTDILTGRLTSLLY